MRRPQWIPVGAAVITLLATMLAPAAPAQARAEKCAEEGFANTQKPWQQSLLGSDEALEFSRGAGIRVAVLDTGVDAGHPRLNGRVEAGFDAVAGGAADDDCLGHGTQVASVIATRERAGEGFNGFAPDATIVPIRVVAETSELGLQADPEDLVAGINAAIDSDVQVIAVSVPSYRHTSALEGAVQRALAEGITVVAAVGDLGEQSRPPTPYPAYYDGVIGVGAVDRSGKRWAGSQSGEFVDLMAPGVELFTLQTGSGMTQATGTGVACGIVAATAALVRARWPGLSAERVAEVLLGTATPTAGGELYGHGVVNPYAAVTNQIVDAEPVPLPSLAGPAAVTGPDARAMRSRNLAIGGAAAALFLAVAIVVASVAIPRGRRRRWRGTLARRSVTPPESEEPDPPLLLFGDRTPTAR